MVSDAGKGIGNGIGKLFKSNKKSGTKEATHGILSVGIVYANDLAKAEIEQEKPQFPVGSIFVREKYISPDKNLPETVIAMVKRENGFSKKSGDWEFFTLSGADLKMQKRETIGDCAKCHLQAEKTDWVFRDYLK